MNSSLLSLWKLDASSLYLRLFIVTFISSRQYMAWLINIFFGILPFNPWTIFPSWLHLEVLQNNSKIFNKRLFWKILMPSLYDIRIRQTWYCHKQKHISFKKTDFFYINCFPSCLNVGFILCFWAARTLPASCPGSHERVWAVYVASVRSLYPFPPPFAPRVFFVCLFFLWELASSPLSMHNQLSPSVLSARIAAHLPSLST
jgi:hypothetical protein